MPIRWNITGEPKEGDRKFSPSFSPSLLRSLFTLSAVLLTVVIGIFLPVHIAAQQNREATSNQSTAVVPQPLPIPPDNVLEPGGGARYVGVDVGLTLNFHSGAFSLVQDGITCCGFDGAGSVGTLLRVRGEYFPTRNDQWGFSGRISLEGNGAEFDGTVQRLPIFGRNDTVEWADFGNRLDVSLTHLDLTGLFTYKVGRIPKSEADLYVSGGLSLMFLTGSTFDKTERIVSPSGVRYLDGTTEKSFPDLQVDLVSSAQFGIIAGAGVRYPIRESLFINWELLYRLPFTDLSPDEDWRMSNILFSAGLSMPLP